MLYADVVVGLQHGDEGKGKVSYHLLKHGKYSYSIRFNGGPNAGHTIKDKDKNKIIVLHQVPCGVLFNITSIIGPGCVIDLKKLEEELTYLENLGYTNVRNYLHVSYNAHIIEGHHLSTDDQDTKIGTTGSGIGPCYSDKYKRTGKRCEDYRDFLTHMHIKIINPLIYFCNLPKDVKYEILCEGAQGFSLDIDWGDYPYCTSSSCISSAICSVGIPYSTIRAVYGCCKLYDTYVGNKSFQPVNDILLEELGENGNEIGSTTGRKRQCNWVNMEKLQHAIFINNCSHIIVNKCDIIEQSKSFIMDGISFDSIRELKHYFEDKVRDVKKNIQILYSHNPYTI